MKFFEALGIVVLIIAFKFLAPDVFMAAKNTLLVFFSSATDVMNGAKYQMTAGFIPNIPTLPQ